MRSAAQERIPIKASYSDMYSKNEKKKKIMPSKTRAIGGTIYCI